jgi:hypothetical protein
MDPLDAIAGAISAAYPGAELVLVGGAEARSYPLDGAVAARLAEPRPHWLVVSRGFTELRDKEPDTVPDVSGWGFELTCRVPAATAELDFGWVVAWMQSIADYLVESGNPLGLYDHKRMCEPVDDAELCAVVFVEDVALAPTESINGRFQFLQMVGLNPKELDTLRAWNAEGLVALMRARDPWLIFEPGRASLLADADFARAVEEAVASDGSSQGGAMGVNTLWFEQRGELELHVSRDAIATFARALRHRLAHGRAMMFVGDTRRPNSVVTLVPESGPWRIEATGVFAPVVLPVAEAVDELLAIFAADPGEGSGPRGHVVAGVPNLRLVIADSAAFREERYPF